MNFERLWQQAEDLRAAAYIAFDEGNVLKARDSYAQALFLYDQVQAQKPDKLVHKRIFHALITLASCALHEQDYWSARDFYLRILATYQRRGRLQQEKALHLGLVKAYIGLGEIAEAALHLLKMRDFALLYRSQRRLNLLRQIADLAILIQRPDIAGELFAEAVWFAELMAWTWNQSELLWVWGQMEYRLVNRNNGRALCRLALLSALRSAEEMRNSEFILKELYMWQLEYKAMSISAPRDVNGS